MKKVYLPFLLVMIVSQLMAQNPGDTIEVRSFNYTQTYGINQWSPGIRDTVIEFPNDPNVSYEKIIMSYNMRCKDGNVSPPVQGQTDIGCGEWDISCNTYIHDSSQVDSVLNQANDFLISGFTGTIYDYVSQPTKTFLSFVQKQTVITNTANETISAVSAGNTPITAPMPTAFESGKAQYLYTAAELSNAGVIAGNIDGLRMDVANGNGSEARFLRIRIKNTTDNTLTGNDPQLTGFTQVYFSDFTPATNGTEHFVFYTPFNWDGTSNLLVEYSFFNNAAENDIEWNGAAVGADQALSNTHGDDYLFMAGQGQYVDAPDLNVDHSNGLTFMAWVRYDSFQRWSRIFDFGNGAGVHNLILANRGTTSDLHFSIRDGAGSSSITATGALQTGVWQHVAATVDAQGNASIYLDGQEVASGTVNVPDNLVRTNNYIGRSNWANDLDFAGNMDDVSYWNTALSQTTIRNWMRKDIDANHPNYSDLVLLYDFNDQTGNTATDQSANGFDGDLMNSPAVRLFRGKDIFKNLDETLFRPATDFVQGTYTLTTTDVTKLDSINNIPNLVTERQILYNWGTAIDDVVDVVSETTLWEAIDQPIIAENGVQLGTVPVTAEGTININQMPYYRRWPSSYEIMSFVTPYGINLDLGMEGKTYAFDLTDFAPILKGKKRMTIERGGQWMEDMDIRFHFIVGTPPRDVLDIKQLWRVNGTRHAYTRIVSNEAMEPRDVELDANADSYKIRSVISGHGQEGEFTPQQHYINIDGGAEEFVWLVWKECAENPVYPQGGTWVYDRAGWCPGFPTDVEEMDITPYVTPGQTANIDYGMFTASGTSNYIVNNQLVSYGPINHQVDATMDEIISPSNNVFYARFNPVCDRAQIRIKNTGATTLTSAKITYGVQGGDPQTFDWTGSLEFLETAELDLPLLPAEWISRNEREGHFYARITEPNGATDEYPLNDELTSNYTLTPTYDNDIIFWFQTNNAADESSYDLRDAYTGEVLLTRDNMENNTLYRDTFDLQAGCYALTVRDSDDDGISFFANNDGDGYARLRNSEGLPLMEFNPNYGDGIVHYFTVGYALSAEELARKATFLHAYPNPTDGLINLELDGFNGQQLELEVYSVAGAVVHKESMPNAGGYQVKQADLSGLSGGMYMLRVTDGEQENFIRLSLF